MRGADGRVAKARIARRIALPRPSKISLNFLMVRSGWRPRLRNGGGSQKRKTATGRLANAPTRLIHPRWWSDAPRRPIHDCKMVPHAVRGGLAHFARLGNSRE